MTHHLPSTIKPLIGKTFKSFINDDPARIQFEDGTWVIVSVIGDCCSSSYIYDVISEGVPEGTPLIDVIENDTESPQPDEVQTYRNVMGDESADGESLSQWDIRFKFEGGSVLVRHINSSNGYYDGYTNYQIG